ncbi:MAG: hypothetical protein GY807_08605 [Gammaproteobacteria bacterium]|nr:hypothetical protein [Gammaproteobacteria bacterium]
MRGFVPLDPESNVSADQFAVVYMPGRNRNRFSANCVEIKQSSEQALLESDPGNKYFAVRLIGPSKSSEGQILYYLTEWLDK